MLTKYVLATINGDYKDTESTEMLIVKIIKLEKLQENKLET
jgi:hypothetical protein